MEQAIRRRVVLLVAAVFCVAAVLGFRLYHLQVVSCEKLRARATKLADAIEAAGDAGSAAAVRAEL